MFILNELYALIKNKLYTPSVSTEVQFKTNAEGQSYILYHLPLLEQNELRQEQGYFLQAHHLSFFEYQDNHKAWLSQYHYTAEFKDAQQSDVRLHVYFDQQDKIVEVLLQNSKGNRIELTQDLKEYFSQLAKDHSKLCLSLLRQQAQQKYGTLEESYIKEELALTKLSHNLPQEREAYSNKLNEMLNILTLLRPRHRQYQVQYRFLVRLQAFFIYPRELDLPPTQVTTAAAEKFLSLAPPSSINVQVKPQPTMFDQQLKDIQTAQALWQSGKNNNISLLELSQLAQQYMQACNEAVMVLDEKESQQELSQLLTLQQFHSESMQEIKRLLMNLMLAPQFDLAVANNLVHYVSQLEPKFLFLAISRDNHLLLDFLLTHGGFAINTLVNADGLTPVLYCYKHHHPEKPKINSLSVLIKHQASLLIPAEDGLPIAHHILVDKDNTLKEAFLSNEEGTLYLPRFYSELVRALERHLMNPNLVAEARQRLEKSLTIYRHSMSSLSVIPQNRRIQDYVNIIGRNTIVALDQSNEEKPKDFAEYPQFVNKKNKIEELIVQTNRLIKSLKAEVRLKVNKEPTVKKINLLNIPDSSATQNFKQCCLDYQDRYIEFCQKRIDQIYMLSSVNVNIPENIKRYQALFKKMEMLEGEMQDLIDKSQEGETPRKKMIKAILGNNSTMALATHKMLDLIYSKRPKKVVPSEPEQSKQDKEIEYEEILELYNELGNKSANAIYNQFLRFKDDKVLLQYACLLSREHILDLAVSLVFERHVILKEITYEGQHTGIGFFREKNTLKRHVNQFDYKILQGPYSAIVKRAIESYPKMKLN